jgi:hypothetical protein
MLRCSSVRGLTRYSKKETSDAAKKRRATQVITSSFACGKCSHFFFFAAHDWSMCKSTLRAAEEKEDTGKPLEVGIGISNTLATH